MACWDAACHGSAHLIRQMLSGAYGQIVFDEAWLCPSAQCHGLPTAAATRSNGQRPAGAPDYGSYRGSEYALATTATAAAKGHVCEQEGCWSFLGTGHKLGPLELRGAGGREGGEVPRCTACGQVPHFPLRAGGGFGWASKEDAQLLRAGFCVAQPRLGVGDVVTPTADAS